MRQSPFKLRTTMEFMNKRLPMCISTWSEQSKHWSSLGTWTVRAKYECFPNIPINHSLRHQSSHLNTKPFERRSKTSACTDHPWAWGFTNPMSDCWSHGIILHFSLQSSHLNIWRPWQESHSYSNCLTTACLNFINSTCRALARIHTASTPFEAITTEEECFSDTSTWIFGRPERSISQFVAVLKSESKACEHGSGQHAFRTAQH